MSKLPDGVRIPNAAALKDAIADGNYGYAIVLAGGAAFSRKTITRKGSWFRVENHIDGSIQMLKEKQLCDGKHGNIGMAIRKGALVVCA